ncbi:tRNA(Ser) Um(44) 2'-O-methyltransferase [Sporothrix stenoceras]|uniref:tRNA (uracil-O(2)-)-methyltransferase n=1 Tax=Sporothrix stenoceras TaxID=5173 RepID=A0ABR3Z2H4_9PEZI
MAAATPPPLPGPEEYPNDAEPILIQTSSATEQDGVPWTWSPMWHRECTFGPAEFDAVMQNLVRNPNVLSSWLFRADMVAETSEEALKTKGAPMEAFPFFSGFVRADDRMIVRRLIPRNTMRDKPMLQTVLYYGSLDDEEVEHDDDDDDDVDRSLVVYLPHVTNPSDVPFYHPKVQGVGFLHEWHPIKGKGTTSMHFSFFPETAAATAANDAKSKLSRPILARVALSLINTVCKHGEGKRAGYVKRVHHDQLVPQARVQDRYTRLKEKYARTLVETWQETTDPAKHVFEDLSIAAFLMELWADMYAKSTFPGFVDVGCGNGLLVHILNTEGYAGWGFDARKRRSWLQYGNGTVDAAASADAPLRESLLLPSFLTDTEESSTSLPLHDGTFPPGTFLIANHADELTAWTPLLAALSGCPFIAIPCCSHNFTGARFRAPPPSSASKEATASVSVTLASSSTYASFVEWVVSVAEDCGWTVEFEMLRIPSTRNVGLIGRRRKTDAPLTVEQAWNIINKYGGAHGFADNVAKLAAEGKKSSH